MANDRFALVSCAKSKLQYECPAIDMYTASALFRKSIHYCQARQMIIFILSAKYGLLSPDKAIQPYELTLKHLSKAERANWIKAVNSSLETEIPSGSTIELHCGKEYEKGLHLLSYKIERPLEGLRMGERMSWYDSYL